MYLHRQIPFLKPNTKKYEYVCRINQMNILHSASFTRIVDLINAIMSKLSLIQFSPRISVSRRQTRHYHSI